MRLKDKVALITGAATGIGRATALLFAQEGAKVAVVDISKEPGDATVSAIRETGGEAIFIQGDVSIAEEAERMVNKTVDAFGGLDILYNNAAILELAETIAHTSEEAWDRLIDVNLKSVYLFSKYAIPIMIGHGGGTIISTASVGGPMLGQAGLAAYCATKAGVVGLTRCMALELAPYHIRVNCVCPGSVETRFFPNTFLRTGTQEELAASQRVFAESMPMKRFAEPEEIARAVLFLASSDANYVNGAALVVDGGLSIQ